MSDRQWRDIKGVLKVQGKSLDLGHMIKIARAVGVYDLLCKVAAECGISIEAATPPDAPT